MFEHAAAELDSLSGTLIADIEAALQGTPKATSQAFLQHTSARLHDSSAGSTDDAFVVVPSIASFPTVQSMVADMEARRTISDDYEFATVLHLQLMLVDAAVMILSDALRGSKL